jgi:branched-chain amino acid transport system substrate-binding protein
MVKRNLTWMFVLVVVVVILLAKNLGGIAQAAEPMKIGVAIATTGKYGSTAIYQLEGYQLWVHQVNQHGGLLGRPVTLLVRDDQSDPETSATLFERLITVDKVDLVLAPYSSAVTAKVAPVTEQHGYPMLASGAASSAIWQQGYRYIFMMATPAKVFLEGAIDLAATRGLQTVAMLAENSLFPQSSAAGAKELLKQRGMELVLYEEYPKHTTDFSAVMRTLQQLQPDVILANTYLPDAIRITQQLQEYNINPKLYSATGGVATPDFYQQLGKTAEYVYGPATWHKRLNTPGNAAFIKAYTDLHGREPDFHSASGYASCLMLEEAVKRAGSLDRAKIRDAMARLKMTTLYGDHEVDDTGLQIKHKMVYFQWQDGEQEIVWPQDMATAAPRYPTPPWDKREGGRE